MQKERNNLKIRIKNRLIGENNPVFVIAEAGINHNGNLKIAKKLIEKAKESGADAIKFQTFRSTDLVSTKSSTFKIFKKLELGFQDFYELSNHAKKRKIIFLSTPFSNEAVDILVKSKSAALKIASGDLTNLPLIKYAASKKLPMIVSTGMGTMSEVKEAVRSIRSKGNKNIIIMHSVSAYPTPPTEVNLSSILTLKEKFPYPVGYSDNGKDLLVPIVAVAMGASIIEKHLTLDQNLSGPDHKSSANPKEFQNLVKNIRNVEKMLGDGKKKCQLSELENRIKARRSIFAKLTINKDEKIKKNMINFLRPAIGIPPKNVSDVIGKKVKRRLKAGEPIKWNDLRK